MRIGDQPNWNNGKSAALSHQLRYTRSSISDKNPKTVKYDRKKAKMIVEKDKKLKNRIPSPSRRRVVKLESGRILVYFSFLQLLGQSR